MDCYSGETAGQRSLGPHTPPCLPDHFCHEAWAHGRPVPIQCTCSPAALLYRKRGLPTRSRTKAVGSGLGGPRRCGQPKQNEGERTGWYEGKRWTPSICLLTRVPDGSSPPETRAPGSNSPCWCCDRRWRRRARGRSRLGMLQKGGDLTTSQLPANACHIACVCLERRHSKWKTQGLCAWGSSPVKAPDQGICPRAHGSPTAQFPFSRQKRRGGSRGPHQPWVRLSSNMSRWTVLNLCQSGKRRRQNKKKENNGGAKRVGDTGEESAAYNRSPAALTFLSQVSREIGACFCTSECSSPVHCSRVQDGAAGCFFFSSPGGWGYGGRGPSYCSRTRSQRNTREPRWEDPSAAIPCHGPCLQTPPARAL